jgi:hypothetical protein
MKKVEVITKEN